MSGTKNLNPDFLPLGNPEFSDIQEKNKIYVDKTELIYKIANQDTPLFFSRPRRFGKSLLINTMKSLFENGLKNFHGLEIEKRWTDKIYKVVQLDFSRFANKKSEKLKSELGEKIIRDFDVVNTVSQFNSAGVRDPDSILDEILQKYSNNSILLKLLLKYFCHNFSP